MSYGIPADWLSLGHKWAGRQVSSALHQRVEATNQDLGVRARCHDCGAMAREDHDRHRARFDSDGRMVVPPRDPLPWALDRLDSLPCEPLGQLTFTSKEMVSTS